MISGGWRFGRVVLAVMTLGVFPLAAVADRTSATAQAAPAIPENVPGVISYQGRLLDGSGAPVTANVKITFSLYSSAQQGATLLWTQLVPSVALNSNGYFSQVLGGTVDTAFPPSVWNGQPVFLGLTVGSDNEMSPRTPIYSVPYALLAPPTVHASNHQYGGGDEVATAYPAGSAIPLSRANGTLDPAWLPLATTSSPGTVPALPSGATSVVYSNDARLSDKRAPTMHAMTHQSGGGDEVAIATPAAHAIPLSRSDNTLDPAWLPLATTSSPGTVAALPSGATSVAYNNDTRLNDKRAPTTHAATHKSGGGDEVAIVTPAANAIPLSRGTGTLDPAWLPLATNSSPGTAPALPPGASSFVYNNDAHLSDKRAPTAHASSHLLNGSDSIGMLLPSAGVSQVPFSDPVTGLIDLSWISTSTVVKAKSVPISSVNSSGGANPLDISWIPVSLTSRASMAPVSSGGALDISWIPVSSTAQASMVPVSSGGALDISWIPASTTPHANTVPVGSGAANTLDPSWIGTLPLTNGGTGSNAPKISRNLCIFLPGPAPTSGSVAPTLPLQPFSSCTATGAYGSAPGNPSGSISVFQGTATSPMFSGNVQGGAFSMSASGGILSIGTGTFLYAISTSGSPSNVTVCVTVTCPAVF